MYFKVVYCIKNKFKKFSDKVRSYRFSFIYNMQEVYTINFTIGNDNIFDDHLFVPVHLLKTSLKKQYDKSQNRRAVKY